MTALYIQYDPKYFRDLCNVVVLQPSLETLPKSPNGLNNLNSDAVFSR